MSIGRTGLGGRRYRTRLSCRTGWPELTALVDILFLALLFFVLASSFVRVSGVSVSLPRVKARNTAALERFVVSLTPPEPGSGPGGNIYFRDKLMDADELRRELSRLHDRSKRATIIIRADRNVPFEKVAEVMAITEAADLPGFIAVTLPGETLSTPIEI